MAFIHTMHVQWVVGWSPLTTMFSTHKSDHGVRLAHRPQGLPDAGPLAWLSGHRASFYDAWGGNMTHGLHSHHAWSVGDGEVTVNQVFNTQKRPPGLSGTQTARLARGRPKHNFPSSGRFFSMDGVEYDSWPSLPPCMISGRWGGHH